MNTVRTVIIFAVLGGVGYGVYSTLNRKPLPDPPQAIPEDWASGPQVQISNDVTGPHVLGAGPVAPNTENPIGPPSAALSPNDAPPFSPPASPNSADAAAAPPYAPPATPGAVDAAMAPPYAEPAPGQFADNMAQPLAGSPDGFAPPAAGGIPNQQTPGQSLNEVPPAGQSFPSDYPNAEAPPAYPVNPATATSPDVAPPVTATENTNFAAPLAGAGASAVAPVDFTTAWPGIQQQLDQGQLVEAHRELSRWYVDPRLTDGQHRQVQELLDQLAGTLIYSRDSIMEPAYEVQPGDSLERIASQYQVPWQLLAKINGIQDPRALNTGEKLKVVRGPFSADVDLTRFALTLWLGEQYAGNFPIGIGADQATPTGTFDVQQKTDNPTYYGPDQVIDANDPANPLGERWISLGNQIGIHGTIDPTSIGKAESRGCIRMTERDIADVFDILGVGSKVTIRR